MAADTEIERFSETPALSLSAAGVLERRRRSAQESGETGRRSVCDPAAPRPQGKPPRKPRRITGLSTGATPGFQFRRIGPGALRHRVRAIAFRGMTFTFVTCTPFAGCGAPSVRMSTTEGARHA